MTAHLPDQQWDLILQSLRASGNNESQLNNIPAAVVVEAGVLVWTYMQTCSIALQDTVSGACKPAVLERRERRAG